MLYALDAGGGPTDLGVVLYEPAAISRDGRWIATTDQPAPANEVRVTDLQTESTMTFPVTSDFDIFGLAFDRDATRLAFVEVSIPEGNGTPWAVVVADLENGTVTRFDAVFRGEEGIKPGYPIGWYGDELLLDTFVPYTEAGSLGVWALALPRGTSSASINSLDSEEIVAGDDYLLAVRLSPEHNRLLYLNRDYDYTPDNYGEIAYDLAVNQLWWMDLETENANLQVAETEGGALGRSIAWSPDGSTALYAEGQYAGDTFDFLTLMTVPVGDVNPTPTEVAPVPLPLNGYLTDIDWCTSGTALIVVATEDGEHQLHTLDVAGRTTNPLDDAGYLQVLGCIHRPEDG
jgi:Tol biopolymer transport system component